MKIFTLLRTQYLKDRTLGSLYLNGDFMCYTLEDAARPVKIKGETCIPTGVYRISMVHSPKFGRKTPRLHDVPGFDGILVHGGNTPEQTEGCILVGHNLLKDGRIQGTAEADVSTALGDDTGIICVTEAHGLKL